MICGNPVRSVLLLATIAVLVSACGSATITGRKGSDGPPASSNASLGRWLEDHVGALNALLVAATLPESHPNSSFPSAATSLTLPQLRFVNCRRFRRRMYRLSGECYSAISMLR